LSGAVGTIHPRRSSLAKTALIALAVVFAIIFSSLGFWQLRRLAERRAQNAMLLSRRSLAPASIGSLPRDTAVAHFRRVKLQGAYDYSREFALTLRTRNGSPGVNIITPLRLPGSDTVLVVNRGWIYAPDGMTAELGHWREPDPTNAIGVVETFPPPNPYAPASPNRTHSYRWLDRATLSRDLREPVAPYYVVIAPDSTVPYGAVNARSAAETPAAEAPPRIEPRALDEGPHKSYAFQWFSFAAISLIGMTIFIRRT
jgi:surfeit locus 1 family protein